jgi:TatD DNase family protein
MIDTHCHLNFKVYQDDWKDVVNRARANDVEAMFVVGTTIETSKKALLMTKECNFLYATAGIHPHHAKQFLKDPDKMNSVFDELTVISSDPKVVAVGEIGIDYHEYPASKAYEHVPLDEKLLFIQKELFIKQVELAVKLRKPVIVHSRKAKDEVLSLLLSMEERLGMKIHGVFHCFEGSKKYAKRILEAGFYISFTGNITYDRGRAEVSKTIPLDRLLLETDSPYMTPEPLRSERGSSDKVLRNEPSSVKIIGQYHAKLRGISSDEVFAATSENAQCLFSI